MSLIQPRRGRTSRSLAAPRAIEALESRTLLSASLGAQTILASEPLVSIVAKGKATRLANGHVSKASFAVTRSHASLKEDLTVNYSIDPTSTAVNGVDLAPLSGTVVIPRGHGSASIPVNPLNAAAALAVENLTLDLQSGSYTQNAAKGHATVTIADKRTLVSITANQPNAQEHGPVNGQFTVTRTGPINKALTVNYALDASSTAAAGVDFGALSGTVVIAKGQTSATIDVVPVDENLFAGSKTVVLDVAAGTYAALEGANSATVTIAENDSPPAGVPIVDIATLANASDVNPTTSGLGQFLVTRTGDTSAAITVNYIVANTSTAVAGSDYTALAGSVQIPAGQASATINVTAIDPATVTVDKTLTLALTNSGETNAGLLSSTMTIAEHAINVTPVVDITTLSNASEVNPTTTGVGQFQVTRQGSTASSYTVNYAVGGSAVVGTNYVALSGSVLIPPGQSSATISVTPINDNLADGSKTVILTLTNTAESNPSLASATMSIADAGAPSGIPTGWWNTSYHDRVAVTVNSGSYARTDKPVDYSINFTTLLSSLGQSGQPLNLNSIRVIETSADGQTVTNASVPFQFDQASNFNAATNASGDLVFIAAGSTAANTTRHYHVYFDTGANFQAANVSALVTTTTGQSDANQPAIEIDTQVAKYFLQTDNGGFSSIIDNSGQDWLNFNNNVNSGSSGEYRGFPNAVLGGGFHAGFTSGTTTIVSSGPLKTTIISNVAVDTGNPNGLSHFSMKYEIYPTYLRATMLQADANYWFLYEGTPGGTINDNDTVYRSDGTATNINTAWQVQNGLGANNAGEWSYVQSAAENRYLYMVHDQPDNLADSYYLLDHAMTVLGFGRDNNLSGNQRELMTAAPNSFTLGLADGGSNFTAASAVINGAYQPLTTGTGSSQGI